MPKFLSLPTQAPDILFTFPECHKIQEKMVDWVPLEPRLDRKGPGLGFSCGRRFVKPVDS